MKLNKTTSSVLHDVLIMISHSFKEDLIESMLNNVQQVSGILQHINDFDMEDMVDLMIWTLWKTSSDDEYDQHLFNIKDFIFSTINQSNQHFNGDVYDFLTTGFGNESDETEDYEEEVDPDLIPDEIYGEVDPEDISFLNNLLKV